MKLRIVALLLAMALLCAVMPAAMADVEVMVLPEDARGFDLHKSAKTISYYKRLELLLPDGRVRQRDRFRERGIYFHEFA